MAKGSGNRGFLKELASRPKGKEAKPFTWTRPVATDGKPKTDSTIDRLKSHKAVRSPPASQQIQKQYDDFVSRRRGKK